MKPKATIVSILKKPIALGVLGVVVVGIALVTWSMSMSKPQATVTNSSSQTQSPPALPLSDEAPRTDDEEPPEATTDNPQPDDTKVTINGERVDMPPSGNLHRTIQDGSSTTTVDVHVDNGSTSTSTSSSSMSVDVQSNSSTTIEAMSWSPLNYARRSNKSDR